MIDRRKFLTGTAATVAAAALPAVVLASEPDIMPFYSDAEVMFASTMQHDWRMATPEEILADIQRVLAAFGGWDTRIRPID